MGDWNKEIEKIRGPGESSEPANNKCICGKPKKVEFPTCWSCSQKHKSAGASKGCTGLAADYLEKGYFDERGNLFQRYIIRGCDADDIALQLGSGHPAMTNHQLRRFYGHVRAADNRLNTTGDFSAVHGDLIRLEPLVSEARGKGKVPQLFYDFLLRNLTEVKTGRDFTKGFLEHFQAVVAYFTYHHPKK